jgi:hypothetical protein
MTTPTQLPASRTVVYERPVPESKGTGSGDQIIRSA